MDKALGYILSKFADHSDKIIDLYRRDEDFRALCEDYLTCGQAIKEYRQNTQQNQGFELEYLQLYIELEKDIADLLGRNQ